MNKRQLKKIKQFKIKSVQKLTFNKNDALVFSIDDYLSKELYSRVVRSLQQCFYTENIVLLTGKLKLEKVIKN